MTAQFREFTLDEALEIARRNDPGPNVPSTSRTLVAEIERLSTEMNVLVGDAKEVLRGLRYAVYALACASRSNPSYREPYEAADAALSRLRERYYTAVIRAAGARQQ